MATETKDSVIKRLIRINSHYKNALIDIAEGFQHKPKMQKDCWGETNTDDIYEDGYYAAGYDIARLIETIMLKDE